MTQLFKTIYFSDHPAETPAKKNVKLAFGDKDKFLYDYVAPLSSEDIRNLLGYSSLESLRRASSQDELPLNSFCIRLLTNKINRSKDGSASERLAFKVDPIQSTFRGGEKEPLHNWYPLLEGYSPRFVESIYDSFAATAKRIFDPFAGTGTTPLTLTKLGLDTFYSEINPLLQYLIKVKIEALSLNNGAKVKVAKLLEQLANDLPEEISKSEPDKILKDNYQRVFDESIFFENRAFNSVLRTRTLIDKIACYSPLASDFLTIAALNSLVPASLLKRAGDLRYKTKEELEKERQDFVSVIKKNLKQIVIDLKLINRIEKKPVLICENAKNLSLMPELNLDAVITSPPYLNGTNYFRNTKIELWFLRCLTISDTLAIFRRNCVTAGINDVTQGLNVKTQHPEVDKVVDVLKKNAYDPRIPKMVSFYFGDMNLVFSDLRKHLAKKATIAIDIGDSSYGGTHVPTDRILTAILEDLGYRLKRSILLRRRLSRDKTSLHQILLVFSYPHPANGNRTLKKLNTDWMKKWRCFKSALPHKQSPYRKRNWGHPLHSLCSYQGKMKPSLAHHLIKIFLQENSRMLDPFGGVGTIPFEASLSGHRAFTFEISPAARVISEAKLRRSDEKDCEKLTERLETYLLEENVSNFDKQSTEKINFNRSIREYFHPKTLNEVLLARRFFRENHPRMPSEYLVLACLLHILHGNRPYALSRRSHPITPFAPTGDFEYRPLIPRLREKIFRSLNVKLPEEFHEGVVYFQDATSWWPQEVSDLDAIITSPPFFDSTRFHLANWMRLWFCGWEKEDFQSKPLLFIDERQKADFSVYESIFRQARERLKIGGLFIMHLGMSKKCDMAKELAEIAGKWFDAIDCFSESVKECESHGISDKGAVLEHRYLILR